MPRYNIEDDTPFGLASADFPVTPYDRPQLMLSNLLRGDVDGLTRAMLSPTTLSPTQMKTSRDIFLKGKTPGPFLKTILDIATNPLVIGGLILGIIKFPIGSTKALLDLRRGLLPKAAAMSEGASFMHDAMNNLRIVPGLYEAIAGHWKTTADFMGKHWEKLNKIFVKAGQITKTEGYAIAAKLDGLHTTENSLYHLLHNEPEYVEFFGSKTVPIAANIQKTMNSRLLSITDQVRGWYNGTRAPIMENPEALERVARAVEKKGMRFGKNITNYFNHNSQYDKYYATSVRGSSGVNYRKHLHAETLAKVGREEFERTGISVARLEQIQELEQIGHVPQGFVDQVANRVFQRWSAEASGTTRRIWADIERAGLNETQQRVAFVNQMKEYYTKGAGKNLNFVARLGNPKKAVDTLDSMAGALQKARVSGPPALEQEFMEIGKVLGEPAKYSLNLHDATGRYLNSIAPSYAWHGLGYRDKVMDIMGQPNVFKEIPWAESYVMDDILPHTLGIKSWPEMKRSLSYTVQKSKIAGWLDNHPLPRKLLGDKGVDWLSNWYKQSRVFSTAETLDSAVASNFYLSALGLNLSSSAKNSLQTFITTFNHVGPKGIYNGLMGVGGEEGLLTKLSKYGSYLSKNGFGVEAREAGFKYAFPEFVEDIGEAHNIVSSMMAGDIAKEGMVFAKAETGWQAIKKFMMMPFATTEAGNRLMAYYAGRNTHLVENATKLAKASAVERTVILREAGEVGQTLNMISNFPGGPLGMPKALLNWRPEFRQFMQFPLRFMGFAHGSLRLGKDPLVRDWGTIGRMLAGSTALSIGARNLAGVDLSGGLMFGALPLPQYEKSPFYPWPFVPPVAQIGGAAVKALMTGSTQGLGEAGALFVPGGIALRRAYKSLSPRFADYENPTPEGRIPLYNNDKTLMGTLSPMELTLRALGLRPQSLSAEQGAAKWLLSQRDRIRQYRRDFTQASFENDGARAEKINREFQRVYPELGPIQIKKSDITALENRREISRLHRIERGISTAYRPIFSRIIGEAGLGRMTEDIQMTNPFGLDNYSFSQ